MRPRVCVFLLLCASVLAVPASSQEPVEEAVRERPRIGLVLSGGGARGTAHIGVLEVLEQARIPIDVIAGTSMGAVVGGLYASGVPIETIEREILAIDWEDVFRDKTPRQGLDFRRKEDQSRFLVDVKMGMRGGRLNLPPGLIQGQKLNLILKSWTLPTIGLNHFDELPIPFRAVAADIDTGEAIVLEQGDLASSIRASMSVPAFMSPVEIDGRRLVDGFIANNLPVDVAQAMGADVLIVVDISTPLTDLDQHASFLGVTTQVLTILMRENTRKQLERLGPDDVLIQPDLGDIGSRSYTRSGEAIVLGEQSAIGMRDELAKLSIGRAAFEAHRASQRRDTYELPMIDAIRIETDADLHPRAIASRMSTKPGKKLELERLNEDIGRVYGMEIFETVDFSLVKEGEESVLVVDAREKKWGPPYLRFGALFTDDFDGDAEYMLGTSITFLPVNRFGAEWRNEVEIGSRQRVTTEFYQPFWPGSPLFVAPRIDYIKADFDFFVNRQNIAEVEITAVSPALDVGTHFSNWGELRVGMLYLYGDIDIEQGPVGFDPGNIDEWRATSRFLFDTFDSPHFPREGITGGTNLVVSNEELGADDSFQLLENQVNYAMSWGPNTLILGGAFDTSLDEDTQVQDQFGLGGFLNLSGLDIDEIRGNHAGVGRLVGYRQLGYEERTPFGMPFYIGGSVEAGNVWDDRDDITFDSLLWSGSAFIGLDTFIGPLYVGYGITEGDEQNVFLFLGGLPL